MIEGEICERCGVHDAVVVLSLGYGAGAYLCQRCRKDVEANRRPATARLIERQRWRRERWREAIRDELASACDWCGEPMGVELVQAGATRHILCGKRRTD